ncbi:hypothetical protein [Hypericibacter sp.]|jgi:hypothetical protein|uniref:hypothetical protein n=1 Tax=Hypericibacter sp. TaxID=2705401 RepID=UPI003D6CFCEC
MGAHKYKVGQLVEARPNLSAATPPGSYKVVRLLPPTGVDNQYRLMSLKNGHERVVREYEIDLNDAAIDVDAAE